MDPFYVVLGVLAFSVSAYMLADGSDGWYVPIVFFIVPYALTSSIRSNLEEKVRAADKDPHTPSGCLGFFAWLFLVITVIIVLLGMANGSL